jgi:uncharacterized protein (TIGR02246 family)
MQSSQLSQVETGEQPVNAARGPNQGPALQIAQPVMALHGFVAAVSANELSSAAAFFTREGCLITPDGTAVHGRPNIAGVLVQLTARHTQIEVEQVVVQGAGDVAFASGRLTMRSDGPDGSRFAQSCDLNLVLRRIEGKWKIAILAPWGTC